MGLWKHSQKAEGFRQGGCRLAFGSSAAARRLPSLIVMAALAVAAAQLARPINAHAQISGSAASAPARTAQQPAPLAATVETVPIPNLRPVSAAPPAAGQNASPAAAAATHASATLPSNATPAATEPVKPLPTPSPYPAIPAEGTTACALALMAFGVKAEAAPGLGEGECRVTAPVTIASAGDIALMPKALLDCVTAATVAVWLRDTVAPKAEATLGAKLTAIRVLGSYTCRTTNNVEGASLSEHAHGRAIDIGAFKVGDRWITVGAANPSEAEQRFLLGVRASACGPFTTVLGPGSDAEHQDHFHLDLKPRQTSGPSHGLFCQ
jgi:hypothetical protein